jgi:hypothetical protein
MKLKENWIAKEDKEQKVSLIEEWKVSRFIKDKPVITVQPNSWGYTNAKLERSFYYIDVWYKFINDGIKFSYYEKRGYKLLRKYIKFPSQYVKDTKNVLLLEKVAPLKYKFVKINKTIKLKVYDKN